MQTMIESHNNNHTQALQRQHKYVACNTHKVSTLRMVFSLALSPLSERTFRITQQFPALN